MLEHELYTIIENTDNAVRIRLRAESEILKGHFPGNPITPGVCQVGMIGELAGMICGCGLALREVKMLKFIDILRPSARNVEVKFDKLDEDGDVIVTKGSVVSDEQVFTKFSLIFYKEA